ncbi:MAG: hypothetical protein JXX28_01835 [Deltaproteobacteria bacterium]|nr:hypothetical protein [Deltaproteobacteria bacterium]
MSTPISLPPDLDRLLFQELGAFHQPRNEVFGLVAADGDEIRRYNGTYLPRTWAESYQVFSQLLRIPGVRAVLASRQAIQVLDVGSGSGGQLLGLLDALQANGLGSIPVNVDLIEGNPHAIETMKALWSRYPRGNRGTIRVAHTRLPETRAEFIPSLDRTIRAFRREPYDLVLSFKFLIEVYGIIGKDASSGLYNDFAKVLGTHLAPKGLLLLLDLTAKPHPNDGTWMGTTLPRETNLLSDTDLSVLLPHPCRRYAASCNTSCYQEVHYPVVVSSIGSSTEAVVWRALAHAPYIDQLASGLPSRLCHQVSFGQYPATCKRTRCSLPAPSAFEV